MINIKSNNLSRSKHYIQGTGFMYYILFLPVNVRNEKKEKNHGKFKKY
jgi:hypothetical protein